MPFSIVRGLAVTRCSVHSFVLHWRRLWRSLCLNSL